MPPTEYLFEWVAAALARELGIRVPEPYAVMISRAFADSINDPVIRQDAQRSCVLSFGCHFLPGPLTQWAPVLAGHPEHRQAASELLAFDTFIHNYDRRAVNPNILVHRDELVGIDHDSAFGFCMVVGAPDPASDPLLDVVRQHAAGLPLKGTLGSLAGFRKAIRDVTNGWFDELRAATPPEWTTGAASGRLDKIVAVLCERRDRVDHWLGQVETWMA